MKQVRWFDRSFDFSFQQNIFPSIIERLEGTPILLDYKLNKIPNSLLTKKYKSNWSIQENIGHLIDLEPLWQGRLEDILSGLKEMRPADLENKKTHQANHNERDIADLRAEFMTLRSKTLKDIKALTQDQVFKYALHPRLKTPMRIIDLYLFVAEHDDHHLATISKLSKELTVK